MAMMAMTTSNSISVNATRERRAKSMAAAFRAGEHDELKIIH
jgi:hypothetical protein